VKVEEARPFFIMGCFFFFTLACMTILYILKTAKRILSEGGMLDI